MLEKSDDMRTSGLGAWLDGLYDQAGRMAMIFDAWSGLGRVRRASPGIG